VEQSPNGLCSFFGFDRISRKNKGFPDCWLCCYNDRNDGAEENGMSAYFTLKNVAQGVWAAIAVPGSGAAGNSSFIDLGDEVVVVDTFLIPAAAADLRIAIRNCTGKEPSYVINTHFHGDHHYGNQIFEDCTIISTEMTKRILSEYKQPETGLWQTALREQIRSFALTRSMHRDQRIIKAISDEISEKEHLFHAVPGIQRVEASLAFTDRLVLKGSERNIEILSYGGGHTSSDAFVYVPDVKLLAAGDLVLSQAHPAMLNGQLESWMTIIGRIQVELEVDIVIPGHGEVNTSLCLGEMKEYLAFIQAYAGQAVSSLESVEKWLEKGIPSPYDEWKLPHVFEWNFRWLFKTLQSEL
jgi:cyclase